MVSANRTLQTRDQCGGTLPCTIHPAGNAILLSKLTTPQVKDQFSHESDYTPKARKPYTITKQRERWTEEEHKKFLEALKLYGRAWRRIKEHVGTKTAVQIRSHAQKFFSKVVRNSSADNTSMVEPVEIPPPRPKRKPMHPYPRKIVNPLSKESLVLEKPLRSSSNLSISEQENQSPTSVLSVSASDATGSTNSNTPIHSVSPVSSTDGLHAADFVHLEGNLSLEDNGCPSPAPITASSASDEQFPKKLDLLPNRDLIREEGVIEETTVRSLKLFGTTVLVTERYRPSSPTVDISKSQPSELNEVIFEQKPGLNLMVTELHSADTECIWSHCPQRNAGALGCMHLQKEKSNPTEAGFAASLPRWNFYGGTPFAFIPFAKQELVKAHADSNREEAEGKETQKEGSLSGSNPGLVHEGGNVCDHSRQFTYGNKGMYPDLELKSDGKPIIAKLRAIPHTYAKGFVPYKKRVVEGESQSSPMTGGEREKQRICLCL